MSSVAYYIPIDQRQADELRHSADASAWAGERLEEVVLNGASIIDDQQWMGMYFTLRQLPQAQVTPELPQAATGIEQLGEEPPVVLVPAEAVSAIADALSGGGAEELEAATENVRAEYPDVLLDDAETSLKALTALYREAAETGKTVAVVVSELGVTVARACYVRGAGMHTPARLVLLRGRKFHSKLYWILSRDWTQRGAL